MATTAVGDILWTLWTRKGDPDVASDRVNIPTASEGESSLICSAYIKPRPSETTTTVGDMNAAEGYSRLRAWTSSDWTDVGSSNKTRKEGVIVSYFVQTINTHLRLESRWS
jgi:hypothetical protein